MIHLYRLYNQQDELLYIGISSDIKQRLVQHRQQPWADEIARFDFSTLDVDRREALNIEQRAIHAESPRYNRLKWLDPEGPKLPNGHGNRRHVWLNQELLDALHADADANGRTLSGTVRYHLRRELGMAA